MKTSPPIVKALLELFQSSSEPMMVLAGFEKPSQRDLWIDELALALHDTQHIVVDLRNTQVGMLGVVLREKLPDTLTGQVTPSTAFVHLINLEATLVEELQEGKAELLSRLESEAAYLPQAVSARCIWWVEPYTQQHLEKEAPNLWANLTRKYPAKGEALVLPARATPGEWVILGNALIKDARFPEATIAFREARKAAEAHPDVLAEVERGMGEIYQHLGLFADAHTHFQAALQGAGKVQGKSTLLLSHGQCLYQLGEFDDALSSFQEALELLEEEGRYKEMGKALEDMGKIYLGQENQAAAMAHLHTAIEAYEEAGEYSGAGEVLEFLGRYYESHGKPENAVEMYRKAAESYNRANNFLECAKSWQHAAVVMKNIRAWQEARAAFEAALEAAKRSRDDFLITALEDSLESLIENHPAPGDKNYRKGFFGKLFGG